MSPGRLLLLGGFLLFSGCLYHAREWTDDVVCDLAARTYDIHPEPPAETKPPTPEPPPKLASARRGSTDPAAPPEGRPKDVLTAAYLQADKDSDQPEEKPRFEVPQVPSRVPGAEAQETIPKALPKDPAEAKRLIQRLYPPLPPLPKEPVPRPGPDGKPYTLTDLQHLASANSPTLRQAASDVQAARGAMIQAGAYPNPTVGYESDPSSDGSTSGVQGFFIDQPIKFAGKLKLAVAAAGMDLRNAELALRRARSDLSTAVRNAYFGVLVARETVRVNKALAEYTDKVYVLSGEGLLKAAGFAAPYEPAALRALAYSARLAYKQSIATYVYAWNQLVAALGLQHLPLTEVAGRIDRAIPYFDYDPIRAHVLRNHTDVLTARNAIDKARSNLKLAQITPYPDVDVAVHFVKDLSVPPKQFTHTLTVGIPFPIWDRNKGNILAAEAALVRATEEPHRVAEALTNTLAIAYAGYKNNLEGLEHYRRFILPDSVRYYQGVFRRRQIDLTGVAFADLVTSQQTLAANVSTYLSILSALWSSVVSVADLLQTDDLFQLGKPYPVPPLPDLENLPHWPCCHECPARPGVGCPGSGVRSQETPAGTPPTGNVFPPAPTSGNLLPPPKMLAPAVSGQGTAQVLLRGAGEEATPRQTRTGEPGVFAVGQEEGALPAVPSVPRPWGPARQPAKDSQEIPLPQG
jgi:cobalt-zinc-cadmium efflux system outer membrane protein